MSEITLSQETVKKLLKLVNVNQSIKIVKGAKELRSLAHNRTTAAKTPIEEDFPRTLCIYDVVEFVSVLNIIKDPIIDLSNSNFVIIKSQDQTQKLRYIDTDERLVERCYFDRDLVLPSVDIDVQPTEEQHKAIMNAAKNLKLDYVGFKADGEYLYYIAFAKNNGDGNETNTFSIKLTECDKNFLYFYETEALRVLDGSPHFQISFSKISKVVFGDYEFFIALDAESRKD